MMLLNDYYFLTAALPPLSLGETPEISFAEFKILLEENLSAKDFASVKAMLLPIDLGNIRALWTKTSFDERGNLTAKELEEALSNPDVLPPFIGEFLDQYESQTDRLRFFSSLYAALFRQESEEKFVAQYYAFERQVRLVLTALRAKVERRDITRELQFEEPSDFLINEILAQKDASDYTPPPEFDALKEAFTRSYQDPKQLLQETCAFRFAKYEEIAENKHFSLDRILNSANEISGVSPKLKGGSAAVRK